jgi:hypothetical protein
LGTRKRGSSGGLDPTAASLRSNRRNPVIAFSDCVAETKRKRIVNANRLPTRWTRAALVFCNRPWEYARWKIRSVQKQRSPNALIQPGLCEHRIT